MTEVRKVETFVNGDIEKVWNCWTYPEHIVNWYFATANWHCPKVVNNLRIGGDFLYSMEAEDGTMKFDFAGVYQEIDKHKKIEYLMSDGRKVTIEFKELDDGVNIVKAFEPEYESDIKLQEEGWQTLLNNFKKYVESL